MLAFGAIFLFSLLASVVTTSLVQDEEERPGRSVERVIAYQRDRLSEAHARGGDALQKALDEMNEALGARSRLLDANGHDLVDGSDQSPLLELQFKPSPLDLLPGDDQKRTIASPAGASGHRLVVEVSRPQPARRAVYYAWIPLAVVVCCCLTAFHLIISPLKSLRQAVIRFGSGDLAARTHSRRRDEIGDLSRAFDQMAERIEGLVLAEKRLLQDVSHELRSPLTRLEFALELAEDDDQRAEGLRRAKSESRRMAVLVGELIDLTRAEGDPAEIVRVEVRPAESLAALFEDHAADMSAKDCEFRLTTAYDGPVEVHETLFLRAVDNVIRNAVRYAPAGSTVDVELGATNGLLRIAVRDHGPGVSEASLEAIFRPFFREDNDRSRQGGAGIGLGLSIARRAIAAHGGTIRAENAQPGLRVQMSLPLVVPARSASPSSVRRLAEASVASPPT